MKKDTYQSQIVKVVVVTVSKVPNVVTPRRPFLIDTRMVIVIMHCAWILSFFFFFVSVEFVYEAFN